MNRLLQLAAALLLTATRVPAQSLSFAASGKPPKNEKQQREDVEWIWQYTPAPPDKDGRENALIQDPHFRPFLEQYLTHRAPALPPFPRETPPRPADFLGHVHRWPLPLAGQHRARSPQCPGQG